ncbi:uncharacterized protein LOC110731031 isoform X2 [Chenopodium quinoa]|uniref:uncharacterized protein LOC110731031 isoform X2 n=1 Tax=Chenopodium quinoa TaxID=63459 RepID=UPI000B78B8C3|nr:uncharacterized protein LOC110731031 isoform X2 [Chenopodium quinoa]
MGESIQGSILRMDTRVRSELMDNVIYLLATVMLILGFTAQFSSQQTSGLILVAAGFFFITIVNLRGFILRLQGKIEFDMFVGSLQCFGSLLSFLSILSIIIQAKIVFIWLGIVGSFFDVHWRIIECSKGLQDAI